MVVDLNVMTATGSCTWCEGRAIQQFADDTALTIIDRRADQIAAHVTHIFIVAAHIITAEESIMCMQHTLQRWHSWRRLAQPCSTWQSLSTKVLGPQQKQRCRTAAGRTPGASCTTRCDTFFPYTIRLLSVISCTVWENRGMGTNIHAGPADTITLILTLPAQPLAPRPFPWAPK